MFKKRDFGQLRIELPSPIFVAGVGRSITPFYISIVT